MSTAELVEPNHDMEVRPGGSVLASRCHFSLRLKLARRLQRNSQEMVTFGRVLLWTVVLVAPGGFLLVPVLAATSLHGRGEGALAKSGPIGIGPSLRQRARDLFARARQSLSGLQRHWTKS